MKSSTKKTLRATLTGTIDVNIKDAKYLVKYYSYNQREKSFTSVILNGDKIGFPRNIQKFLSVAKNAGFKKVVFKNRRQKAKLQSEFELSKSFKLRDYQKKGLKKLFKIIYESPENAAILKASAGSGKSFVLPKIVQTIGQRTLILVDRENLKEQIFQEFSANTVKADFQILDKNSTRIADVNIATFQFLLKNPSILRKLKSEIGLVIVDEAHVISIGAFTNIVAKLPARYRIGLTATPSRSDGLTQALFDHMSYNIVDMSNPNILPVKYVFVHTPYSVLLVDKNPTKSWAAFFRSENVINLAVDTAEWAAKSDRAALIYATFQGTHQALLKELTKRKIPAAIINQNTPKETRQKIFEDFSNGDIKVLISGTILQKGISLHRLDTIINIANHTKESFEQAVGRLRREHPDKKQPLYIDFAFLGAGLNKYFDRFNFARKIAETHNDVIEEVKLTEWHKKLHKLD